MNISNSENVNARLTEADTLLTRQEAATYLRRSIPALERWAREGTGPAFKIVQGRALYSLTALRRFAGVDEIA